MFLFANRYDNKAADSKRLRTGVGVGIAVCTNNLIWRYLVIMHGIHYTLRPGYKYWYYKHMYFESRAHAGQVLARLLHKRYRYEDCAVIALTDGGVLVGEQIAAQLHCALTMLVTESIEVPGESVSIGAVSQGGNFTYNNEFSSGEIEEYVSEFHGYFDDKKREAFGKINRLIGDGGAIGKEMLRDRVIILVSDGFSDGAVISVALDYLKPIRIEKLVIVAPVATIPVVDKLHVVADELHILDVKENFISTNHYYDDNSIPTHEESVAKINQMILNWQ